MTPVASLDKSDPAFDHDNMDKGDKKAKVATDVGFYNGKTISRLGPGNFFGEGCIFPDIRRDWIVEAMSEVKLYFISRGDILNNVDSKVIDIIRREAEFKATYYDGRFEGRNERVRPSTRK